MMDIKGLFVWTLVSVIRVIQLISTLKNYLFRTFQSLESWPVGSRVITGFLQLLESLGSLIFYLFLVSISFAYTSWNPMSMGLHANASDKNSKPIYVIKWASGLCEWLLQSLTQWLDQLDHQSSFVCVSVSRITWINGSVIHSSKQIAPNKCQAYRMKILSLTLSFSYREHYIVVSDLVRFWYNFSLVHFSGGQFSGWQFSRGHISGE